jgi:hypothetical protein
VSLLALLVSFLSALCAQAADVQCMSRLNGSWAAVQLPAAQISLSACSESFLVGTQLYKLNAGPTRTDAHVTCSWDWTSTGRLAPPAGVSESYACNLFL